MDLDAARHQIREQARRIAASYAGRALADRTALVSEFLFYCLTQPDIPQKQSEAMRYSLLAGGKRLRPVLCLSSAALCGEAAASILPFAAGLEMIHTYSLIHDDLPAMDNDTLRRGKPTNHVLFGEGNAILAGDGLLTDAFLYMSSPELPAERILEAVGLAAVAAGSAGMVGGQILDLTSEGRKISLEELNILNAKKTGALLRLACESGAVLAGADAACRKSLVEYGTAVGLAFQITDDLLDVEGDAAQAGKHVGRDAENGKATWPSLIGVEASRQEAVRQCDYACTVLQECEFPNNSEKAFLLKMASALVGRGA